MADLFVKNEQTERRSGKREDSILQNVSKGKDTLSFSVIDLIVLIFSVVSIISDLCTDLVLVIEYSKQGYKAWAIGTFLLIFFPSLIVQFFSLRWYIVDKTASVLHWVLHFCMLGIVHRYVQIIKAAFGAYKSKSSSEVHKVFLDQSDLCMLHLFESFLESAPQLVLQMYVIVMLHEWRFWTGLSALASLLSLAWALAAYTKAQRRAKSYKNSSSWPGLLLQAIWRTGMLTSRISTLVLGAYCFGNYFFIIIGVHWVAMTVWIISQKTDFCETYWEERIYNAVVGIIYCFCFFNLQEGQSRWRALAFYLVIVFQNLICLTIFLMWFGEKTPKLAVSGFIAVVGGTVIGATSMLIYYRFFHPSGPIKIFFGSEDIHNQELPSSYPSMTLRSLKRMRCEAQCDASPKSTPRSDSKHPLNGQSPLSDSVVIIEENVLDDTDVEIKILQDWINEEGNEKNREKTETEKYEDAYKRRAICSSVDLVKLIESKTESETDSLKLVGTDEVVSEVLSAHDYENLCAVNIARETWGLRSWRGYSDIETWLHDDSVIHDRRLDTLTSTTSSDRSANTQKVNERTRQDDYIDSIAEDLAQCESEASSDDILGPYAIESLSVVYPLGTLDPIFEEVEESSTTSTEFTDSVKVRNGPASTLVATIEEIRRNTPTQNRYRPHEIYDGFSPLDPDIKPKQPRTWKKVKFASKLLTYPEDPVDTPATLSPVQREAEKKNFETPSPEVTKEGKENLEAEMFNKENIPTVASKINHWNKILSSQCVKNIPEKSKGVKVKEKRPSFLIRVATPPDLPVFQRRKEAS